MTAVVTKNRLKLEKVQITSRNFSGKDRDYSRYGMRSFTASVPDEYSLSLKMLGWPVQHNEGGYFLNVRIGKLKGSGRTTAETVVEQPDGARTRLLEDKFHILDDMEIESADLTVIFHEWNLNGVNGTLVYLTDLLVRTNNKENK